MPHIDPDPRTRRVWPVVVPFVLVAALAAAWTGGWFYAVSVAEKTIAGWREREARSGRVHACASQTIGGFPFRIEVRCTEPSVAFMTAQPQVVLKGGDVLVAAQIYDPTLLISELSGPATVAEPGRSPSLIANWKLAQSSVRGRPRAPERASLAIDRLVLDEPVANGALTVARADRVELHARVAPGGEAQPPAIDLVVRLAKAELPNGGPFLRSPTDADVTAVVRGLKDLAPKPWSVRLRDLQAAGGKLEVSRARLQQGDVLAVAVGTLALTPRGRLDGTLRVTVAGLEKIAPALGIDKIAPGSGLDRLTTPGAGLDRILPGLGGMVRNKVESGGVLGLLGEPAELEGRKAVTLPLRISDGAMFLGPVPVGKLPPLF